MSVSEYRQGVLDGLLSLAVVKKQQAESRARAIRAVVAAQWAVAVILALEEAREDEQEVGDCPANHHFAETITLAVAALPTPEQIVDGIGGGR